MPEHGLVIPTRGVVLDGASTATIESNVLSFATEAESFGFDGLWVGDSVLAKPRLEPLSTLASVAALTDDVSLGSAVYLPGLRHPVNVAHQTATVDRLSGGRLSLGLGVGIGPDVEAEYDQLDVPFGRRGALLDEVLSILEAFWGGDPVDFAGEFFDLDGADLGFTPARRPPVYVASAAFDPESGFPKTIRDRLAAHGDGWMPLGLSPDTYAAGLARARGFLDDVGRDPSTLDAAYYHDVVIADTEADAVDQARAFLDRYYPAWGELSDDQIRARGAFGPPEVVADHLDAYAEAGVETFVTRFATTGDQRAQLDHFADLV